MKATTIRGIDAELERGLVRAAREAACSVNKLMLRLLREGLGLARSRTRVEHHDLDRLAGTWSKAQRRDFEQSMRGFSQVDPEMWR